MMLYRRWSKPFVEFEYGDATCYKKVSAMKMRRLCDHVGQRNRTFQTAQYFGFADHGPLNSGGGSPDLYCSRTACGARRSRKVKSGVKRSEPPITFASMSKADDSGAADVPGYRAAQEISGSPASRGSKSLF